MLENKEVRTQRQFLVRWSILNLLGWVVGVCFVFLIESYLAYNNKYSVWNITFMWLPFGASIGLFQWFMLRRLGINFSVWVFVTALGYGSLAALYIWGQTFGSFEYRMKYAIPYWIINVGLAITLPVGGAIIGSLQSIAIRKHISRFDLWIRAYIFGLLLPLILILFSFLVKSFFLNLLYSAEFYTLVDLRWLIYIGFLIIVTSTSISILTGNILLKHSNINSSIVNVN